MTYTFTRTITPRDVYRNRPDIPSDKRVVAFRPPKRGETFLSGDIFGIQRSVLENWPEEHPRLILEDVPPPQEDWWE